MNGLMCKRRKIRHCIKSRSKEPLHSPAECWEASSPLLLNMIPMNHLGLRREMGSMHCLALATT